MHPTMVEFTYSDKKKFFLLATESSKEEIIFMPNTENIYYFCVSDYDREKTPIVSDWPKAFKILEQIYLVSLHL